MMGSLYVGLGVAITALLFRKFAHVSGLTDPLMHLLVIYVFCQLAVAGPIVWLSWLPISTWLPIKLLRQKYGL
jgi:hypothetical protein